MKPDVVPERLDNPLNYKAILLILVGVLIFQSVLYFIPESESEITDIIISIVSFVNPLAASIASFVIYTRYKGTRVFGRAYFSLGLAYLMVFAAEVTYLVYDLILQLDPYPSIADVFFFALYPFTIIHIVLNAKFFNPKLLKKEKKWLFIISIPVIVIYLTVSSFPFPESEYLFDYFYGVLFAAGSAITLAFAFIGVKIFREGTLGTIWLLLVIGILTNTIGDVWYYHLEIFGEYDLLHPVNIFWYFSYWLIVYALYKHKEAI